MIQARDEEGVRVLVLDRGGANALDAAYLHAIAAAFEQADADGARGVVLTAQGKIFCGGLDLLALAAADREDIVELIDALALAVRAVFTCARPTVAALNGHAVAGGALLALACDLRLMTEGPASIGLTEVKLGLSLPASSLEMLRYPLGRSALETLVYGGQLHAGIEARALGVVDELVALDDLVVRAIERVLVWTPSPAAFADIKARLHAPVLAAMDEARTTEAGFVDDWFAEPARSRIAAAVAQLRSRSR